MKNIFIALFILISLSKLNSQNWCTPNSEWHHTRVSIMGPGYAKLNYAGTVTINSQVCQQLNYYSQIYYYSNSSIITNSNTPYRYTYEANNVVYLYNQNTSVFDTLYNFGATIGSKWLLPANYPGTFSNTCTKYTITVQDTGHSFIQTANLKWFKVSLTNNPSQFQYTDTIYQRLGLLNYFFYNFDQCTGALDYMEGGPLRCFSDNQIINYKRIPQPCTFLISGITENEISQKLELFPNPAFDHLTLMNSDINDKIGKIYFYNILGEEVKKIQLYNNEQINIEDLNDGIYFVKYISADNKIYSGKIIKN